VPARRLAKDAAAQSVKAAGPRPLEGSRPPAWDR
jgi:hypothetical protein